MSVMKYFLTIIGTLCVWLFAVLVIDFNDLLDLPMFIYALILGGLITGAHFIGTKRYGNPGAESPDAKTFIKFFVLGFLILAGTIVAALVTSAAINPDARAELSAPFVTCERDDSQIVTVSVGKQLEVDGGMITIHSITTNVPQSANNPQPYAYTCQKAALADISFMNDSKDGEALDIRDLELVTTSKKNGITAEELNSSSQYTAYATSQNLTALRQSRLDDSRSERGWVAFEMDETDEGDLKRFIFDKYGQNKAVDLK